MPYLRLTVPKMLPATLVRLTCLLSMATAKYQHPKTLTTPIPTCSILVAAVVVAGGREEITPVMLTGLIQRALSGSTTAIAGAKKLPFMAAIALPIIR